jgi:thiol-disulfide isomerase/thioredoxin
MKISIFKKIILAVSLMSLVFILIACDSTTSTDKSEMENTDKMDSSEKKYATSEENMGKDKSDEENMNDDGKMDEESEDKMDSMHEVENSFELINLSNETFNLNDYYGKKVYIKFWASWCPVCLGGLEELEEFSTEKKDNEDVEIVTIVSPDANGEKSADEFKQWFKGQDYDINVLLDQDGKVTSEYGIRAYPTSVFINTDGEIAKTLPGHLDNENIEEQLNHLK